MKLMFEIQHKNYPEADDTSLNNSDWSMKKWSVDFFIRFAAIKKKAKKITPLYCTVRSAKPYDS